MDYARPNADRKSQGNKYAVASFDFIPSVNEELPLLTGEILLIKHEIDQFWMFGEKLQDGTAGQFPKDFIKPLDLPSKDENSDYCFALDTFYPETTDDLHFAKGDIIILDRTIDDSWAYGHVGNQRGMFPLNYVQRLQTTKPRILPANIDKSKILATAIATMSLKAQLDEELSFNKGDEIGITEVLEDSWHKGTTGTITGIFPSSFVQLLTPIKSTPEHHHQSLAVPLNKTGSKNWKNNIVKQPLENKVSNGNVEQSQNENLSSTNSTTCVQNKNTNSNNLSSVPSEVEVSSLNEGKNKIYKSNIINQSSNLSKENLPVLFKVYALHNFVGSTSEELAFGQGDAIDITEESDEHWYMGKIGIRSGYVPKAYVSKDNPLINSTSQSIKRNQSFNQVTNSNKHQHKLLHSQSESNIKQSSTKSVSIIPEQRTLIKNNNSKSEHMKQVNINNTEQSLGKNEESLLEAVVLYNYMSQGDYDLTICTDDKLKFCSKYDENWSEVINMQGEKGIVPTNYIKINNRDAKNTELVKDSFTSSRINNTSKSNALEDKGHLVNNNITTNISSIENNSEIPVPIELPNITRSVSPPKSASTGLRRQNAFNSPRPFHSQSQSYKPIYIKQLSQPVAKPIQHIEVHEEGINSTTDSKTSLEKVLHNNKQDVQSDDNLEDLTNSQKNIIKTPLLDMSSRKTELETRKSSRKQKFLAHRERRAHSYVNTEVIDKHLHIWQSMIEKSPDNEDNLTELKNTKFNYSNDSENIYETPISQSNIKNTRKLIRRSASMRESASVYKNSNYMRPNISNFGKIQSDSNLQEQAFNNVDSDVNHKPTVCTTRTDLPTKITQQTIKVRDSLSTSTGSTESLTSFSESRNSQSTHSDTSGKDRQYSKPLPSQPTRVPPPLPPHRPLVKPSPISPPPPRRKESLQNRDRSVANSSSSEAASVDLSSKSMPPARPAPMRPPVIVNKTMSDRNKSMKLIPPKRPFNPPKSSTKMKPSHSQSHKLKMEKIRSDIEEYSRMKADLQHLYNSTTDGKERREISENMEFVKANLRRLQLEFQNLINDSDHIYESIEAHKIKMAQDKSNEAEVNINLDVPAAAEPPSSPSSIRKRKLEKRMKVANELVSTEEDFLHDVTITIEDIMIPLIDKELPIDIPLLFSNIQEVKEFSQSLFNSLTRAVSVENSMQDLNDSKHADEMIGSAFINHIPRMEEVYSVYCRGHDDAIAALEKYEEDPEFQVYVNDCLTKIKEKTNVFDLGSFLIKPVQRILKYPLLLHELLKLSELPPGDNEMQVTKHPDHGNLLIAVKKMEQVAVKINEGKRRKDLVRKYRKVSHDGISDKIGRISIKSGKKKISRISRKFGRVTGLATTGERDEKFDELEKRFKIIERAVKYMRNNIESYCDRCQEVLTSELAAASHLIDFVNIPDRSHPVAKLHMSLDNMAGAQFRHFHNQVHLQVLTPLSTLLARFKGPQTIIDKRFDKLMDYDACQKNADSKEKLMAAKNDYEALNTSLLDELPKLCDLSIQLISSCVAIFVKLCRFFQSKLAKELLPIIQSMNEEDGSYGKVEVMNSAAIIDKFNKMHAQSLRSLSELHLMPGSLGSLFTTVHSSLEANQWGKSSTAHPRLSQSDSTDKQTNQSYEVRQSLLKKYTSENLCIVKETVAATQVMDLPCQAGEIVGVRVKKDPMGSSERWFIDTGAETGFVPSSNLRPFNMNSDGHLLEEKTSSNPIVDLLAAPNLTPVPAPRRTVSPNSSFRSSSSVESSGSVNSHKVSRSPSTSISPYMLRQSITSNRNTATIKDGTLTPGLTNAEIMEVFDQEDEILDSTEYDSTETSKSSQHFRADYDFSARSNLELTVKRGDILTVILQHDIENNPEWWLCANAQRQQGYVPANYLSKAEYL